MNADTANQIPARETTVTPSGQRNYSTVRLSRHALDRFAERFAAQPAAAAAELRCTLSRTRRLGRSATSGAIAVLAVHRAKLLVAIVRESTCLTVMTWNQFAPLLADFGRAKLPRKWGRLVRRLAGSTEGGPPGGDRHGQTPGTAERDEP
jgi:hypothetical protein